jgi:hypothetical protein
MILNEGDSSDQGQNHVQSDLRPQKIKYKNIDTLLNSYVNSHLEIMHGTGQGHEPINEELEMTFSPE